MTSQRFKIFILDGLENLDDIDWISSKFSSKLTGIFSMNSENSKYPLKKIQLKKWKIFNLQLFGMKEKESFLAQKLKKFGKRMDTAHLDVLKRTAMTNNPLFMSVCHKKRRRMDLLMILFSLEGFDGGIDSCWKL